MALGWVHRSLRVGPRVHHRILAELGEHRKNLQGELEVLHKSLLRGRRGTRMSLGRVPRSLHRALGEHCKSQKSLWLQQYCFPLPINRHLHSLRTWPRPVAAPPVYLHLH